MVLVPCFIIEILSKFELQYACKRYAYKKNAYFMQWLRKSRFPQFVFVCENKFLWFYEVIYTRQSGEARS